MPPTESTASTSTPAKHPRTSSDKNCNNPNCTSKRGHTLEDCMAFGGGNCGKYTAWWKGPWNIHLPPDQRCGANNIPPTSHPAHKKALANSAPKATVYYAINDDDTISCANKDLGPSTTDNQIIINQATMNETPAYNWNTVLDGDTIVATLPVLEQAMVHNNICHHDSGAN